MGLTAAAPEVLQRRGERGGAIERALHVLVAEHRAARGEAGLGLGVLGQLRGHGNSLGSGKKPGSKPRPCPDPAEPVIHPGRKSSSAADPARPAGSGPPKPSATDRQEIVILVERIRQKIHDSPRKAATVLSEWLRKGKGSSRKPPKAA